MPKMKTRKAAAKRLKKTGTGKFRRYHAGGRHLLTKKSSKRKRRLRSDAEVHSSDAKRIKRVLPYG
ncbi:MAG: 50S ribosomal protein L35 [Lentisphaeria bacterium]